MPYIATPKFTPIYPRKYLLFPVCALKWKNVDKHSTGETYMPWVNPLASYVQTFSDSQDFPMAFQTSFSHGLIPVQMMTSTGDSNSLPVLSFSSFSSLE